MRAMMVAVVIALGLLSVLQRSAPAKLFQPCSSMSGAFV
jgi:hypothetical protein